SGAVMAAMQAEMPLGLWVYSAATSSDRYVLTVAEERGTWVAAVQGEPADIVVAGDEITIHTTAGQSFTGQVGASGTAIEGYWEQGANEFAYSRMVTRVRLEPVGPNRWQGEVQAQPRPFTVFLDVFADADGQVAAVLRNPERNEILAARFRVEATGERQWDLIAGSGDNALRLPFSQSGLAQLTLAHPWFDRPLMMRPASAKDARRYFPRTPQNAAVRAAPPPLSDDDWRVIGPRESGYDRALLDALVQALAAEDPRSTRPRMVHAMLIAHRGRLLFEEYFYGHDRATRHDTRSLAKVFGPIMVGALRQQGSDIDPDDRIVTEVLADAGETSTDPRKSDITLGQLMSYTSGLDCDAGTPTSRGSEDNMWSQEDEQNFWRFTARLPLLYDPGTRYAYCSGSINMAGASISAASGLPVFETFERLLARPLGFATYHWNLAPNGAGYLGGGVYLRPRDILKLGAMYAAGGEWRGQRIVSGAWVTESTRARIDISPATTRLSQEAFNSNYFGGQQAYVWRRDVVNTAGRTYASYEATGNGGQILLVVPELELAVVFTGGNYRWGSIWGRWRDEFVGAYVIPAILPDS
ncbi:MAG: serine hydrolase domain-containing protein, partial [Pseudomonadota bacterium]